MEKETMDKDGYTEIEQEEGKGKKHNERERKKRMRETWNDKNRQRA